MKGLGLTLVEGTYLTPPPEVRPRPKGGIRLPYYRTAVPSGAGEGPNGEPGQYIDGVFYPAISNSAPVTTSAPAISVPAATTAAAGPLGLSEKAFQWIVIGGLVYLLLARGR